MANGPRKPRQLPALAGKLRKMPTEGLRRLSGLKPLSTAGLKRLSGLKPLAAPRPPAGGPTEAAGGHPRPQ